MMNATTQTEERLAAPARGRTSRMRAVSDVNREAKKLAQTLEDCVNGPGVPGSDIVSPLGETYSWSRYS